MKVCLNQGWKDDGQMRKVAIREFVAAVGYSERGGQPLGQGEYLERDEVECQLANMIYKVCQSPFSSLSVWEIVFLLFRLSKAS